MKYIVCEQPGKFRLEEKEFPTCGEGEAILKIKKVGICGTDLHAYAGNQAFFSYPRILGHELAAEVLEIKNNNKGIKAGDKVIVMPYISNEDSAASRNGKPNCCPDIKVLGVHVDGGMQEQIAVPIDTLILANHLSYKEMAIVEPLAIGAHSIRRSNIQPNEFIAVVGCGPIGIGILKLAQIRGAKVIAIDTDEKRLQYAKNKIGVNYIVKAGDNAVSHVSKITKGDLCTAVFDASGNKNAIESCPDFMSHGGRFIIVGLYKGELTFMHPKIHAKEMTLICSRNATIDDFKFVTSIIDQFPTDTFVTHEVSYNEMINSFESWLMPKSGVIKAMVDFNQNN